MGVLNIELRRENVGNIGGVRMANVNTGAERAAEIRTQAIRDMGKATMEGLAIRMAGQRALAKGVEDLGEGVMRFGLIAGKIAAENNRRKVDEAVAEYQKGVGAYNGGTKAAGGTVGKTFDAMYQQGVNEYNIGEDGAMRQTIEDADKWLEQNNTFLKTFQERLKGDLGLTDAQYEAVKSRTAGFTLQVQNQWMDRAQKVTDARDLKTTGENARLADANVAGAFATPLDWQEWANSIDGNIKVKERVAGRTFSDEEVNAERRMHAMAVYDNMTANIVEATVENANGGIGAAAFDEAAKRFKDCDADAMLPESANVYDERTGKAVGNYMKATLDEADFEKVRSNALDKLSRAKKAWVKEQDAKAEAADGAATEALTAEMNAETLASYKEGYVVPDAKEKVAAVMGNPYLKPDSKEKFAKKWEAFCKSKNEEAKDRREKNGYEVEAPGPDGKMCKTWISAASFGKTDARMYERLMPEKIAEDPVGTLVDIEALKATGNISESDYKEAFGLAVRFQDAKTVAACKRVFGGKLMDVFKKLYNGKGDNKMLPDERERIADAPLYYKYDPDAKAGYSGGFGVKRMLSWGGVKTESSVYEDMRQEDARGEALMSVEDEMKLIDEVRYMTTHGFTDEQIDKAVQKLVAPAVDRYYRMTMDARFADPDFMRSIRDTGGFNARVATKVSSLSGKNVSQVRDSVAPKK